MNKAYFTAHITILFITFLNAFVTLGEPSADNEQRIAAAVKLLKTCPAWSAASPQTNEILACCKQLDSFDTALLRSAIQRYVSECLSQNKYNITAMSKLFVLNRYLFNVPHRAKFGGPFFGGWEGIPYDTREMDVMWPLGHDKHGQIAIVGKFGGYSGESFAAVQEFDYFLKKYGRRKHMPPRDFKHTGKG